MKIALCGISRVGKDVCGDMLVRRYGLTRVAFGDIIKRQLDPLIREHFGFSAFTEVDAEKKRIRGTLEQWGYDNYDAILAELFDNLPGRAVNTRLFRVREAKEWRDRGGVVWEVTRKGVEPATEREAAEMQNLRDAGLIDDTIANDGDFDDLEGKIVVAVERMIAHIKHRLNVATLVAIT